MSADAGPREARRPWRAVVVATAAVLALLAFSQVVAADAPVFAVAALLYAAGALFIGQGRAVGFGLVALPSLVLVVTLGWTVVVDGVSPADYETTGELLVAVLGLPLAAVNLFGAVRELLRGGRDQSHTA